MSLLKFLSCCFIASLIASPVQAVEPVEPAEFGYVDAVILGFVEGITEFLPISSTGHLILTNQLLGLDGDTPVLKSDGTPVMVEDGSSGMERPYTIGKAAYAYVIVIQAGAIAAVVLLYWKSILDILLGCIGKSSTGRLLARNLIAAFLPAAVIGLLLDDIIESALGDNTQAVATALIVGAVVMLFVEKWRKKRDAAIQLKTMALDCTSSVSSNPSRSASFNASLCGLAPVGPWQPSWVATSWGSLRSAPLSSASYLDLSPYRRRRAIS